MEKYIIGNNEIIDLRKSGVICINISYVAHIGLLIMPQTDYIELYACDLHKIDKIDFNGIKCVKIKFLENKRRIDIPIDINYIKIEKLDRCSIDAYLYLTNIDTLPKIIDLCSPNAFIILVKCVKRLRLKLNRFIWLEIFKLFML